MDTLRNQLDIVLSTGLVLFCSVRPAADVELQSSYSIHWNAVAPKRGFNCIWQRHHNIFSIIDDRKRFRIPWPTLNQHLRKFPFSILARSMSLAGWLAMLSPCGTMHTYVYCTVNRINCLRNEVRSFTSIYRVRTKICHPTHIAYLFANSPRPLKTKSKFLMIHHHGVAFLAWSF